MQTKICNKCNKEKDINQFHKSKTNALGVRAKCKKCRSQINKNYYRKDPSKKKKYFDDNKEKILQYRRMYFQNKRDNDPDYKLRHNMSRCFRQFMKGTKEQSTWKYVDYTLEELKSHLESLFTEGMTWENYGAGGWEVDHIVPQSSFDFKDSRDIQKCWSLDNLQPLWLEDNRSKGDQLNWVTGSKSIL